MNVFNWAELFAHAPKNASSLGFKPALEGMLGVRDGKRVNRREIDGINAD